MKINILSMNLFETPSGKKKLVLNIFIVITIVGAIIIGWNYYDVLWWIQWYRIIASQGLAEIINIYKLCVPPECKVPYPPLAILIFVPLYAITSYFQPIIRMVLLKAFIVLIPGIVIYMIIKRAKGADYARLWLLSWPFLQILFCLQFDVLIALFIMLSTIMILKRKTSKAALFLGLATMVKHVVVILLPLHIVFLKINGERKEVLKYIFIYALVVGCIALPFFVVTPREFVGHILLFHSSRAPQDMSLWALATILLEKYVVELHQLIDNIWALFFATVYTLSLYLFWRQLKLHRFSHGDKLLLTYTSVILLLFISLNKVGNLNYVVWFVPLAFLALNKNHLKIIYKLTFVLGLTGGLVYGFMLLIPPASADKMVFIPEDLIYWNAKALVAQSLNPYIFFTLSLLIYAINPYSLELFSSPTDFVTSISLFKVLYILRPHIIVFIIIISQILLSAIIVLKLRWLKEYISNSS
ncbi:MAG: glycosyltransferase 87 family protein [Ignisphaera sp.]